MRCSVTITIMAPVKDVWQILVDVPNWTSVISGITRLETVGSVSSFGPDFRWRETRVMMGREETQEMYVTSVDPLQRIVIGSDAFGAHYVSEFVLREVEGSSGRCELVFNFSGQPLTTTARVMSFLLGWLFFSSVRKMMRQDLDDIKAVAEERLGT